MSCWGGTRQEVSYDGSTTFNITTLMGRRDQDEQFICVRRIVEGASQQGCSRYPNLQVTIVYIGAPAYAPSDLFMVHISSFLGMISFLGH